jgi:hypothetical protein
MNFGPIQLLVVGFDGGEFKGEIMAELRRLREHDVVRLVDLLVVNKADDGSVTALETSDLSEAERGELGAIAASLAGFDDGPEEEAPPIPPLEEEVWYVADAIPPGTTAAIAVLEHRWAIPLRDAIGSAGGKALADAWLHPSDLGSASGVPASSAS